VISGLIFDFDGVLANSEPLHAIAVENAFKEMAIPITPEDLHSAIGLSDPDFFSKMVIKYKKADDPDLVKAMLMRKRVLYMEIAQERIAPLPGVAELLEATDELPKAIATTCMQKTVNPLLENMKLRNHFRLLVGWDDVEHCKPHPEPYLKAAQGLGLKAGECMAFEDSPTGAKAAIDAGCVVTAVLTNFKRDVFDNCDFILEDFADTQRVLELIRS
jgi:HAD superfamily hydrolase (TIGR01509 family)